MRGRGKERPTIAFPMLLHLEIQRRCTWRSTRGRADRCNEFFILGHTLDLIVQIDALLAFLIVMVVQEVVFSHGTIVVEIGGRRAGDLVNFFVSTMIDVDNCLAHFVALNQLPLCVVAIRRFFAAEIED